AARPTTGPVPHRGGALVLALDLVDHAVVRLSSYARRAMFPPGPGTVADFHRRTLGLIGFLGGSPHLDPHPNEVPGAIPFPTDHTPRPYDVAAVSRFFEAPVQVDAVFREFRTSFLAKPTPVHLFWGSFDLAVTRFS